MTLLTKIFAITSGIASLLFFNFIVNFYPQIVNLKNPTSLEYLNLTDSNTSNLDNIELTTYKQKLTLINIFEQLIKKNFPKTVLNCTDSFECISYRNSLLLSDFNNYLDKTKPFANVLKPHFDLSNYYKFNENLEDFKFKQNETLLFRFNNFEEINWFFLDKETKENIKTYYKNWNFMDLTNSLDIFNKSRDIEKNFINNICQLNCPNSSIDPRFYCTNNKRCISVYSRDFLPVLHKIYINHDFFNIKINESYTTKNTQELMDLLVKGKITLKEYFVYYNYLPFSNNSFNLMLTPLDQIINQLDLERQNLNVFDTKELYVSNILKSGKHVNISIFLMLAISLATFITMSYLYDSFVANPIVIALFLTTLPILFLVFLGITAIEYYPVLIAFALLNESITFLSQKRYESLIKYYAVGQTLSGLIIISLIFLFNTIINFTAVCLLISFLFLCSTIGHILIKFNIIKNNEDTFEIELQEENVPFQSIIKNRETIDKNKESETEKTIIEKYSILIKSFLLSINYFLIFFVFPVQLTEINAVVAYNNNSCGSSSLFNFCGNTTEFDYLGSVENVSFYRPDELIRYKWTVFFVLIPFLFSDLIGKTLAIIFTRFNKIDTIIPATFCVLLSYSAFLINLIIKITSDTGFYIKHQSVFIAIMFGFINGLVTIFCYSNITKDGEVIILSIVIKSAIFIGSLSSFIYNYLL